MFMEDVENGHYDFVTEQISEDTDILVSHQPPYGILDHIENHHWGSETLYKRVNELHLHYHLFGHDHNSYGTQKQNGTVFSNAAVVDHNYVLKFRPKLFELK